MKLNLLFIMMDTLIIIAYPIVFVRHKFRLFTKAKENTASVSLLTTSSGTVTNKY